MKVLILTRTKEIFLKKHVRNEQDYLSEDAFFSGWKEGFEKSGWEVFTSTKDSFILINILKFNFRRLYFFLFKVIRKLKINKIDNILLSFLFERKIKKEKINIVFVELNETISPFVIKRLQIKGVIFIQWFGLFPHLVSRSLLQNVNNYDLVFCPGDYSEEFKKFGVSKPIVTYIGSMINQNELFHEFDSNYSCDISFVGGVSSLHSERIAILEEVAKKFDNFRFYGYGVDCLAEDSILKQKYQGWADKNIMRKVFSSSKISLNLTLDNYHLVKRGFNIRLHEITACKGALELVKFSPNIDEFYDEKEVIRFVSVEDLLSKIEYYLEHEQERISSVEKAHSKSFKYTYSERIPNVVRPIIQNVFNRE